MISTVQQRVKSVDYQILQWSTLKLFQYHSHSAKAKATFGNIERALIALYNYVQSLLPEIISYCDLNVFSEGDKNESK